MLFAVRQRHGHDFYLPRNGEALWECFDLDVAASGPEWTHRFDEVNGSCNYDARVFDQPDGTGYHGYFQSYRYLDDCKAPLAQYLRFRPEHRARSAAIGLAYRRRHHRPLVALHVRRGDYLVPAALDSWGDLAGDGYYQRAIAAIGTDVTYVVFSDDLAWCRQFFDLESVEFADFDHNTSLALMTECDVNVIANSTFSWWGAFLNPRAEVYAPSRWFGPAMPAPNDRQDDILPPAWRTIPTFADVRLGDDNQRLQPPDRSAMTSSHPEMVERLEMSEADDGMVVYDEAIDRVHHLNTSAAVILQLCDGTRDAREIAEFLAEGYGLDAPPVEQTAATLEKLAREGLIR